MQVLGRWAPNIHNNIVWPKFAEEPTLGVDEGYKMPSRQKPDDAVAGSSRRLHQVKTGHYLTRRRGRASKTRSGTP